jgi:hypothetical protein
MKKILILLVCATALTVKVSAAETSDVQMPEPEPGMLVTLDKQQSTKLDQPIAKLLVFPETKRVRVDWRLAPSQNTSPLDFEASITRESDGDELWSGALESAAPSPDTYTTVSQTIERLSPDLWEPSSPVLYRLRVVARQGSDVVGEASTRFGFRSMTITNGQFHLNGRPIFLRGIAINPPGRTIPAEVGESREFVEAYVKFLKSQNVNIFRLSVDVSPVWYEVCDEVGMMQYAGRYGIPFGATEKRDAPEDYASSIAEYMNLFENYVNHPSIVLYYLSNELPVSGTRGEGFSRFLTAAHAALKEWDPTRPYIGNAGYGEGREGDVCDVHRYWGWYYNSFLTYYNLRDKLMNEPLFGENRNQPLTFTECVGSFTGSSGEFNVVRSKQLGPRLGWIGATETPVEDSLAYQCKVVKEATESFRRMRPLNPRLAGIMPFSIFFYNWSGIRSFEEMKPKPAMDQLRISYQPVLLSWELWTHQVYSGARIRPIVHVINDADHGRIISNAVLNFAIQAKDGRVFAKSSIPIPDLPHFQSWSERLDISVPRDLLTAEYKLVGWVENHGLVISTNWADLFVAEKSWGKPALEPQPAVHVYDRSERTIASLAATGVKTTVLKEIKAPLKGVRTLVIGENAWDLHLTQNRAALRDFVRAGGRIICLQQQYRGFVSDWLPVSITNLQGSANETSYPPATRPHKEQSHVNMARFPHPVFVGLDRKRMQLWSDYTSWDQTQKGFPRLHPVTAGFRLSDPQDLQRTAILADYDRGLEGIALCEVFDGLGSVILSAFDIVNRTGIDPAADRLLANLVFYAAQPDGHEPSVAIERPIQWGNLPSEQGVVSGSLNGLLVNAEWVRGETQEDQPALPANTGAWNMMPGDQFIPFGRNPFGPYTYSTGSSLRSGTPSASEGEGFFFARPPRGTKNILTIARNPGKAAARFAMSVNGQTAETIIGPGKQESLTLPLPWEDTLQIRFKGPKDLVLIETRFE